MSNDTGWHLNKNVNITVIFAVFMSFMSLIGSYYTLDKRISLLEQSSVSQELMIVAQNKEMKDGFSSVDKKLMRIEDILLELARRSHNDARN